MFTHQLIKYAWRTHMACNCFEIKSTSVSAAAPDPTKHVNYVLGMVLGEDDFKQEFAYLAGRDQWLARDLIGYGTVRGLRVHVDVDGSNGPRINVESGVALSPKGQLICVPAAQCASINDWLLQRVDDVRAKIGSPPASLSLYVTLCYRCCPDDDVPIPGEPCRSEDQLTKPSRLRDDFSLELRLNPPRQREEDAVRDFVDWLGQIDMSDPTAVSPTLGVFLDAIRAAVLPLTSPLASPLASPVDFLLGSPPTDLRINPGDAREYLRAAFRLWTTELRPRWIERWCGCATDGDAPTPAEACVLLAAVQVPLLPSGDGFLADDRVLPSVHEERRPFVVSLRLLQEWLLARASAAGTQAPLFDSPPASPVHSVPGPESPPSSPPASPPGPIPATSPALSVVAAGTFRIKFTSATAGSVAILRGSTALGGLGIASAAYDARIGFSFRFTGFNAHATYIVKLIPWWPDGAAATAVPFRLYQQGAVSTPGAFHVRVQFDAAVRSTQTANFSIEVDQIA
jgi:hypothetical protein